MPKNVTVQFNDGTSHIYEDVPDDVTNEQVNARATQEFNKSIDTGPTPEQTLQQKQTNAWDLPLAAGASGVNMALQHPGLAAAGAAAAFPNVAHKVPGVGQVMDIAKSGIEAMNANTAKGNVSALGQLEHQARQYIKEKQPVPEGLQKTLDSLRNKVAGPVAPSKITTSTPGVTPGEIPQMTNAQKIVQKLALGKILHGAGLLGTMAAETMYTSPEEIAVVKQAEAKRRAQGWKPLNER